MPLDPQILAVFDKELLSASAPPGLIAAGPTLWPRFTGYYERLSRLPRRLRRALQHRCSPSACSPIRLQEELLHYLEALQAA
jgi:hypothetical protein